MSLKFLDLVKYSLPVFFGYIPLGMAYGFLMTNTGFDWQITMLFSLLAYAGALQFFAVPLFVSHASLIDFALATIMVNFRHIFYGISVFHYLPDSKIKQCLFMHQLTDETYSLLTSQSSLDKRQAFWLSSINHFYWILGSALGIALAQLVKPISGIDFVLVVLFMVLFIEQLLRKPTLITPALALLACVINSFLFPAHFLIATTLSSVGLLYLLFKFKK